ncbi:MAG: SET domain-containing protein-lysine N-methyltransferase [Sphingobacteriales bacterium]|nr:MAG: SET domain-containing protein-lysine N-methyltransferase [Sphingobacteriales bacterium]
MILPALFIAPVLNKGRGVYTAEDLVKGTIIEVSPVIVMTGEERVHLDKTTMHDYIFEWGSRRDRCCVALGYVSVYNHSYSSNCEYEMDYEYNTITIKTVRSIGAGEELTINYNGTWNNKKKVWFDVKD